MLHSVHIENTIQNVWDWGKAMPILTSKSVWAVKIFIALCLAGAFFCCCIACSYAQKMRLYKDMRQRYVLNLPRLLLYWAVGKRER